MCVTFTYTRGKLTQCAMQFTKHLHEPIRQGKVNCSVRIWLRPHVKIGGRYRLGPGQIEVTAMREIAFADITPELARRSGFKGVVDLLKTAKHGRGSRVYLIDFRYVSGPSLKER
jgi:hypothetical protein